MTADRTVDLGPTILYGTRRSRVGAGVTTTVSCFFEHPCTPIMHLMHPGDLRRVTFLRPFVRIEITFPTVSATFPGYFHALCALWPIRDSPTLLPHRFTRHDSHPGTQIPPGNPSERILTWVPAAGIVYRGAALFRLLSLRIGARRRVPDSSDLQGGPRLHSTLNPSHLDGSGEQHPSPAARGLCPY